VIWALCSYLLVGLIFALGVLAILESPPEYDSDWERFRAAFFADPNRMGVLLFTVCVLFWPGIAFFPFREPKP